MKEIEKKWMIQPTIELQYAIAGLKPQQIQDFYFNQFTRLRNKDNKWFLTIKSQGTFVRDEFEIELDKTQINFLPRPFLKKKRYLFPYKNHVFELNKFENLGFELHLLEVELKKEDEEFEIPEILNKGLIDVTNNLNFYGWGLYSIMKDNIEKNYPGRFL